MTATQSISQLLATDTPSFTEVFDALRLHFPLLDELENTPQDSIWHAEGNVRIHTEMVFHEMNAIIARHEFSTTEIIVLRLAALLHDIAKPLTSRYDEREGIQRIISPHHADKGRSYCSARLWALFGDKALWQTVMALIGHHHDLKPLVKDGDHKHLFLRLARHVSPRLLYYLELADTRGRICADKERELEVVEMFRLYAEEYNLWESVTPYAEWKSHIATALAGKDEIFQHKILATAIRDYEAGTITTAEEAIARSYHQRLPFSEMVVMCGVSGSGKSEYIQQHYADYHCISLDDIRERIAGKRADQSMNGQVLQAAQEELRVQLRAGKNVVWDATNLNRELRGGIIQFGMGYDAFVKLIAFVLPEHELRQRNAKRRHEIPNNILQRQIERYDVPYLHEAHAVEFIGVKGMCTDI